MATVRMTDYYEWQDFVGQVTRHKLYSSEENHYIETSHGIVVAIVWTIESWKGFVTRYTRLTFIWNDHAYYRSWKTGWAPRTITTLARKMVEEITERSDDQ